MNLQNSERKNGGTGAFFSGDEVRRLSLCAKARGITKSRQSYNPFLDLLRTRETPGWGEGYYDRIIKRAGRLFKIEQERYFQPGRKFAYTMRTRQA